MTSQPGEPDPQSDPYGSIPGEQGRPGYGQPQGRPGYGQAPHDQAPQGQPPYGQPQYGQYNQPQHEQYGQQPAASGSMDPSQERLFAGAAHWGALLVGIATSGTLAWAAPLAIMLLKAPPRPRCAARRWSP